jgi:hypothetical protein
VLNELLIFSFREPLFEHVTHVLQEVFFSLGLIRVVLIRDVLLMISQCSEDRAFIFILIVKQINEDFRNVVNFVGVVEPRVMRRVVTSPDDKIRADVFDHSFYEEFQGSQWNVALALEAPSTSGLCYCFALPIFLSAA